MKPLVLLLLAASFGLGAAEKPADRFHFTLLGDAPPMFDASGKAVVPKYITRQKYLVLYFSASWCGPCHHFNPEFIKWYKANGGGKDFEVILVGHDEDTASIKKYMKDENFPWVAFEKKGTFEAIDKKYCGEGIPCVVVLDDQDRVVADSFENGQYIGPMAPLEKLLELEKAK